MKEREHAAEYVGESPAAGKLQFCRFRTKNAKIVEEILSNGRWRSPGDKDNKFKGDVHFKIVGLYIVGKRVSRYFSTQEKAETLVQTHQIRIDNPGATRQSSSNPQMPDRPLDTINDALQNPEISDAFRTFLKSEFSDENMEFHEKVTQLAQDAKNPGISDQQLKASAGEIYKKFIPQGSERQVNISTGSLATIEKAMKGIEGASREQVGTMLDGAHQDVVKLMDRDSLKRFQRTAQFPTAREQANGYLDTGDALEKLQARERRLKLNPSLGDKGRAMVTPGGMVTMIREVERQREVLEQQMKGRVIATPTYGDGPAPPTLGAPRVAAPQIATPLAAPLELEAGTVGRGRSNGQDASSVSFPEPKQSVREALKSKDATLKVGQEKSPSVSDSDKDPSKISVREKIKLFEKAPESAQFPKRGVK